MAHTAAQRPRWWVRRVFVFGTGARTCEGITLDARAPEVHRPRAAQQAPVRVSEGRSRPYAHGNGVPQ